MSEDHDHNHYQGSKNILVAFVLNATFSLLN